jgi:hypothetical protein
MSPVSRSESRVLRQEMRNFQRQFKVPLSLQDPGGKSFVRTRLRHPGSGFEDRSQFRMPEYIPGPGFDSGVRVP